MTKSRIDAQQRTDRSARVPGPTRRNRAPLMPNHVQIARWGEHGTPVMAIFKV
jgi:hypothetical protein